MEQNNTQGEIRIIFPYGLGAVSIPRNCVFSINASYSKYEDGVYDLSDIIITTPSLRFTVEKVYQGELWVDAIVSYIDKNSRSAFISCKVSALADEISADTDSFMESEFIAEKLS